MVVRRVWGATLLVVLLSIAVTAEAQNGCGCAADGDLAGLATGPSTADSANVTVPDNATLGIGPQEHAHVQDASVAGGGEAESISVGQRLPINFGSVMDPVNALTKQGAQKVQSWMSSPTNQDVNHPPVIEPLDLDDEGQQVTDSPSQEEVVRPVGDLAPTEAPRESQTVAMRPSSAATSGTPGGSTPTEPLDPKPLSRNSAMPESGLGTAVVVPIVFAAAAAAALLWYRLVPALGALFTRVTKNAAAQQRTRRMILGLLEETPGLTVNEIMQITDLAEGTVRYHLRVLQRHSLVEAKNSGRHAYFFSLDDRGKNGVPLQALALLRCRQNRDIVMTVCSSPGIHQGGIAERMGMSQSQVHARAKELVELNVLRPVREGRRMVYHPTVIAYSAVATVAGRTIGQACRDPPATASQPSV